MKEARAKTQIESVWRERIWGIFVPVGMTLIVDQVTKALGAKISNVVSYGDIVFLKFQPNYGMMMGSMAETPEIFRTVALSTAGAFIFFLFAVIQLLVPLKSLMFRAGLSIFVGGVLGNIIDRTLYGYVIDFVMLSFGSSSTGVFNIADALQWVGVAMVLFALVQNGEILWPEEERRGRKWIKPDFQWRYVMTYSGAVALTSIVLGTFSYTFLRFALEQTPGFKGSAVQSSLKLFSVAFTFVCLACVVAVALVARSISHRIAGPILAFENFLENLLQGRSRRLRLREQDEFAGFEQIADRFQEYFQGRLGVEPEPLKAGYTAPQVQGVARNDALIDLEKYRGQKVWLCLYRYATCPLCVSHMAEIMARHEELVKAGVQVIAVFESRRDQFVKPSTGRTAVMMEQIPFPLIADPEKTIYRAYRTRVNVFALFHLQVVLTGIKALAKGFMQGTIDGKLGQIPAHFLISEDGKIHTAFYGKHLADNIPWERVEAFAKDSTHESSLKSPVSANN